MITRYCANQKPTAAITDGAIRAAAANSKADRVKYYMVDSGCPGLRLFIIPDQQPIWFFTFRNQQGGFQRVALGNYPQVSIQKARAEAWTVRKAFGGITTKRRGKKISLIELIDKYDASAPNMNQWPRKKVTLLHIFRPYCSLSVTQLSSDNFRKYVALYPAQGAMRGALTLLGAILRWGEENGLFAHREGDSPEIPPC